MKKAVIGEPRFSIKLDDALKKSLNELSERVIADAFKTDKFYKGLSVGDHAMRAVGYGCSMERLKDEMGPFILPRWTDIK